MNRKIGILLCPVLLLISMLFVQGCSEKMTLSDDVYGKDNAGYTKIDEFEVKNTSGSSKENIGCCAILIPDDYVESQDTEGMYVSTQYPLNASNIYYTIEDSASLGFVDDNLTEADYESAIEEGLNKAGNSVDVVIDSFEKVKIEGVDCYKIRSHYSVESGDIEQLTYIVAAQTTHIITYTQTEDDGLIADFVNDEGRLKLVREISES